MHIFAIHLRSWSIKCSFSDAKPRNVTFYISKSKKSIVFFSQYNLLKSNYLAYVRQNLSYMKPTMLIVNCVFDFLNDENQFYSKSWASDSA